METFDKSIRTRSPRVLSLLLQQEKRGLLLEFSLVLSFSFFSGFPRCNRNTNGSYLNDEVHKKVPPKPVIQIELFVDSLPCFPSSSRKKCVSAANEAQKSTAGKSILTLLLLYCYYLVL